MPNPVSLLAFVPAFGQAVSPETILAKDAPKLLSEFGFFADGSQAEAGRRRRSLRSQHAAVFRSRLEIPLCLCAAWHRRRPTTQEAFEFPVGSALIKTFAFPADLSKPDENVRLIETRVLLKREAGWFASPMSGTTSRPTRR
jgi:hypothetical protein